jgi:TRAP-type C4-dicarboxylate transport system permease small subunit
MGIRKLAGFIERVIHTLSKILNIIGVSILGAMMLLSVADVSLRFLFNSPILGTVELTEYMMVSLGFLMLAWCARNQGNVRVDLIVNYFPPRLQAIIDSATCFFSLIISYFITWQGFLQLVHVWKTGKASTILKVPTYPFFIALVLGSGVLCLVLIAHLIQLLTKAAEK